MLLCVGPSDPQGLPLCRCDLRVPVKMVADVGVEAVWEAIPPLCLDEFGNEHRQHEEAWETLLREGVIARLCFP